MKDYSGQARKVNFVNIPRELKANASFCVWKMEKRSGKPAKVPYDPRNGQMARTNEPGTFTDFGTAMKAYAMGGWDGIGFRVSEGIGAIDIDHWRPCWAFLRTRISNAPPQEGACADSSGWRRISRMTRRCTTSTIGSMDWKYICPARRTGL